MAFGEKTAKTLKPGTVIALHGPLGAGKTTFVKGIARGLGIDDIVTSPTFTLITEYNTSSTALYHMDLYRIESFEDFIMIGGEELMLSDNITIIEWAEKIKDDLPKHTIDISIKINSDFSREIKIKGME